MKKWNDALWKENFCSDEETSLKCVKRHINLSKTVSKRVRVILAAFFWCMTSDFSWCRQHCSGRLYWCYIRANGLKYKLRTYHLDSWVKTGSGEELKWLFCRRKSHSSYEPLLKGNPFKTIYWCVKKLLVGYFTKYS